MTRILYDSRTSNKNPFADDDLIVLSAIGVGEMVSLDDIFKRVRSHAFFGSCDSPVFESLNILVKHGVVAKLSKNGTLYFYR